MYRNQRVGRTGTFVGMEMLVHKLLVEKDSSVSAVETVTKLRDQRMHAVQNDQQYGKREGRAR